MEFEYLSKGNVVSLITARRDIKFPAVAQIEAYWHGLRNGRLMPTRSDIDPRGIAGILTYSFILERVAQRHARIRLAGQHLNDVMAMEVRGMPITSLMLPNAREEFQATLETAFDMPAEVHLRLNSQKNEHGPSLEGQMILLPLKDHEGRVTRILGALQVVGELPKEPCRFRIGNIKTTPLTIELARGQKILAAKEQIEQLKDIENPAVELGTLSEHGLVPNPQRRPATPKTGTLKSTKGHILKPSEPRSVPKSETGQLTLQQLTQKSAQSAAQAASTDTGLKPSEIAQKKTDNNAQTPQDAPTRPPRGFHLKIVSSR